VYTQKRKPNRVEVLISGVLLVYGVLVRIDALPGFIPLAALWVLVVFRNKPVKVRAMYVLAVLIVVVGVNSIISVIAQPEKKYATHKLFMHDLSGIYVETGDDVFPPELYKRLHGFDTSYIRAHFHTATNDMLWWNNDNVPMVPPPDAEMDAVLKGAWWNGIKKHPATYIANRLDGFWYYLRIKVRPQASNMTFYKWIHPNEYGLELKPNRLRDTIGRWIDNSRNLFYMQAWFWMLMNILLFIPLSRIRDKGYKYIIASLLLSSLLFRLPQVFIYQTDTDFRYFYWTCIACTFAAILIVKAIRSRNVTMPR
ncbi:MAG: hypothetical protein KDC11_14390, partial [Chitinophagaceae bacterium]|nr:hypothetical protein [Chitinophagaceae bacterium]